MAGSLSKKGRCDWCGQTRVLKKLKFGTRPKTKKLPLHIDVCAACEQTLKRKLEKES